MNPDNINNASRGIHYELRKRYEVYFDIREFQNGRHFFFKPPITRSGDVPSFYVVFKRNFFMSFNKVFEGFCKAHPEYNSIGESLNINAFNRLADLQPDFLLVCYDSGRVYSIPIKELQDFVEQYTLIRSQDGGEKTVSFPISILKRWGDL